MANKNFMALFKTEIEKRVSELLTELFEQPQVDVSLFKFEIPPDDNMGHLAFACFPLARILKKGPPQIAQMLASSWGDSPFFEQVVATGPYLNFFFSSNYLAAELVPICIDDHSYGNSTQGAGKTVMIEFPSPNTNKPLHLGHCRNILLGTSIANLLECTGYQVARVNLVNDRGIHICKSMHAYQQWGNGETPESSKTKGDKLVGRYYVLYDQKEKENPEILQEVQQLLRDWEQEEPNARELWKTMNGWVLEGFDQTFQRLGTSFDKVYYESETYQGGKEAVLKALESGVCQREENGAVSIDLEADKLGKKILLRGDGTAVYMTQDINTTIIKFTDFDLDGSLFVVGNEQDNHFRVLFKTLEKFGYEWAKACEHVSYGMINLPEGKMKSREGTVVDLDDLMDKMNALAMDELKERYGDEAGDKKETAEAISQSAIKFFILKTNAVKEMLFDPKESLSFDGATGPYLQYTHARICSLLKKVDFEVDASIPENYTRQPEETKLLVQLSRFPDAVLQSANDRNPAVLCAYCYDLCRMYNKFYYEHQILKAETRHERDSRVLLSRAAQHVIAKSLNVLSIRALERM